MACVDSHDGLALGEVVAPDFRPRCDDSQNIMVMYDVPLVIFAGLGRFG